MLHTARVVSPTSMQVWKLIEQDYTLRLSLVANEWATEHLKAWNAVFAEGRKRGNAGYYGPALVEMEIADANKRAEWSYQTCCEIWEVQGRLKSRPFFRAIFDWCLQPMFSTREACFKSRLELHRKRTAARIPQGRSAIGGHMKREIGKIRAEWNTKLEIAARDNEYRQQRTPTQDLKPDRTSTAPIPVVIGPVFTWKELETRFENIQSKAPVRHKISVWFTVTKSHSGSVTEEWKVEGNSACRVEFEKLASIAARKLGYTTSENATKYWLDRVREWMQRERLDKNRELAWLPTGYEDFQGHRDTTQHLFTERIAELSAKFCLNLMADDTPESVIAVPSERSKIAERRSNEWGEREHGRASASKRPPSRSKLALMRAVFATLQTGDEGLKYCRTVDSYKPPVSQGWKDAGWPGSYAKAYPDPKWAKKIQNQKSKIRRQFDAMTPKERSAIIGGVSRQLAVLADGE